MGALALQDRTEPVMPITKYMVRCYLEQTATCWQAFSLEFGLAVQGESQAEVMHKLEQMIRCYIIDALTVDKDHAEVLLSRTATWKVYVKYYMAHYLNGIGSLVSGIKSRRPYSQPLPLMPSPC